mmetsp:Transcript_18103/g.25364  ORF Transcript_18103/g.25364 Transcript_18103/m.25364 type:complete len:262 (-) Transcript_18103:538-1323(-)
MLSWFCRLNPKRPSARHLISHTLMVLSATCVRCCLGLYWIGYDVLRIKIVVFAKFPFCYNPQLCSNLSSLLEGMVQASTERCFLSFRCPYGTINAARLVEFLFFEGDDFSVYPELFLHLLCLPIATSDTSIHEMASEKSYLVQSTRKTTSLIAVLKTLHVPKEEWRWASRGMIISSSRGDAFLCSRSGIFVALLPLHFLLIFSYPSFHCCCRASLSDKSMMRKNGFLARCSHRWQDSLDFVLLLEVGKATYACLVRGVSTK